MTDVLVLRRSNDFVTQTYELTGPDGDTVLDRWTVNVTAPQREFNRVMDSIVQTVAAYLRRDDDAD